MNQSPTIKSLYNIILHSWNKNKMNIYLCGVVIIFAIKPSKRYGMSYVLDQLLFLKNMTIIHFEPTIF